MVRRAVLSPLSDFAASCVSTATMFTLKNQAEDATHCVDNEAEDDFKTDEEEEMEVESQGLQKRKKVCGNLRWHLSREISSDYFLDCH